MIREADGDLYGDGVKVAACLEQLAEAGGVMISGTAYDQLHSKLDVTLDFAGEQRVKNIERFVRAYRVRLGSRKGRRARPWLRAGWWQSAVAAMLPVLLTAGAAWWLWPQEARSTSSATAVLPFANLGGDPATGRLADGITEDTITDLARFRGLDVIARNSIEVYKGKAVDVRQVGEELDVGYVLEGSVQREADRMRITAQLVDTQNDPHGRSAGTGRRRMSSRSRVRSPSRSPARLAASPA
ncbi:hypothetical protein [Geminicoccus flavidas]|uniref:hypothetical protein n=1 Tax=Geminicoccus flavidas TaxID=2506407 RepID=UPI001F2AD1C3|nr:hypothetical protein [Geminicoccus flavidas]